MIRDLTKNWDEKRIFSKFKKIIRLHNQTLTHLLTVVNPRPSLFLPVPLQYRRTPFSQRGSAFKKRTQYKAFLILKIFSFAPILPIAFFVSK